MQNLDAIRFEVLHDVPNTNVRLTVTPSRATLKFVPGLSEADKIRFTQFAGIVAGEMYAKGVTQTWRGKVKNIDGCLTASMYVGENRKQYWHHKEKQHASHP